VRAERLIELLRDPSRFWPHSPVPSVPIDAPQFQEARYWKGPTWINISWAVWEGLRNYGHEELAEDLRLRLLELVEHAGFFEYFSPITGEGFGAADFSWTAALVIDLLAADPARARP
jgi:neutral trehalase